MIKEHLEVMLALADAKKKLDESEKTLDTNAAELIKAYGQNQQLETEVSEFRAQVSKFWEQLKEFKDTLDLSQDERAAEKETQRHSLQAKHEAKIQTLQKDYDVLEKSYKSLQE